jgi:hypothetical protein
MIKNYKVKVTYIDIDTAKEKKKTFNVDSLCSMETNDPELIGLHVKNYVKSQVNDAMILELEYIRVKQTIYKFSLKRKNKKKEKEESKKV